LFDFLDIYSPQNIIVVGDLNLVNDPKEKRGGNSGRYQMLPLVEELILHWDVLDFKPKKGLYTWTKNRVGTEHIFARLDRFLAQSFLLLGKRLNSLKILPKLASDHKPILL